MYNKVNNHNAYGAQGLITKLTILENETARFCSSTKNTCCKKIACIQYVHIVYKN